MGFGKEEEDAEEDELSLDETSEGLREDERDRVPMAEAKKKSWERNWGKVDLIKALEEERNTLVNDPVTVPGRVIILTGFI